MAAKYTAASNATVGDRLLNVGQAAVQLSDGSLAMLVHDPSQAAPNKVSLQVVPAPAHTTPQTVATLSTDVASAISNFTLGGFVQSLALCRDSSDNLYVVGGDNVSNDQDQIGVQAFLKGSGLTWSPQSYVHRASEATEDQTLAGFAVTWCDTGGGTNGAGHLLVICDDTGSDAFYLILDAGMILKGNGGVTGDDDDPTFVKNSGKNPTFLGVSAGATTGSNLALSADGFGASTGIAASANSATTLTVGGWGVTSGGALTTGGGLVNTQNAGAMSATTKISCQRYAPNAWVVAYRSSTNLTQLTCRVYSSSKMLGSVDTGTASNYPAMGATLSWDVTTGASADLKVYVYGWSSALATTMLRLPVTMSVVGVPSVGAAISDDTSVGSAGTTIRSVGLPVDILHTDWQSYQSTTAYGLLGDFSTISSNPYPPTLLTPINNAIAPISTGGTFTWLFGSPVIGDAQTALNFRRQISGGAYQWWDGAAWQSTSQTVTTASTLITFPTSQWTAAATYTWWVQV